MTVPAFKTLVLLYHSKFYKPAIIRPTNALDVRQGRWWAGGGGGVGCSAMAGGLLKDLNRAKSLLLSLLGLLLDLDLLGDLFLLGSLIEFLLELLEAVHGDLGSGGDAGGELEGSSSKGDLASIAFPDSTGLSSDLRLNKLRITLPQGGQMYLARC